MSVKDFITNEKLDERFENHFELVNHAILVARDIIIRGDFGPSHLASEVLEMIVDREDHLGEELEVEEKSL